MKRRPFFLLEALIATLLIGIFSYLSIHGSFRLMHKQKQMIKAIEDTIDADLKRMQVIERCWNTIDTFVGSHFQKIDNRFWVKSKQAEIKKYYLLEVEDRQRQETYSYLVTR
jgi:hypothetical protein